jgi:hypothetical protein
LPSASAPLSDRVRVRTVGVAVVANLVSRAVVLRDRGPPAIYWAGLRD